METWAVDLARPNTVTTEASLNAWDLLGSAVSSIGDRDFGTSMLTCLNQVMPVDFWSVYRVRNGHLPQMFISGSLTGHDVSVDCFERYQGGLYKSDQTFDAARQLASNGIHAMTRWNEGEIPGPHRDQIYRRHDIEERLSVVEADADSLLAINMYRYRRTGGYTSRQVDALHQMAPFLLSCVGKHLQVTDRVRHNVDQVGPGVRQRLSGVCPALTNRELDVCERLLKGLTYEGIALDLGLSLTSVKTYRARAFDRLGIHFRNQLFALVDVVH